MNPEKNIYDVAILGGGIAGGLLWWAIRKAQPQLKVIVLEKAEILNSQQTWSFHHADIPTELLSWISELPLQSWNGYAVSFPNITRSFNSKYYSISGHNWDVWLKNKIDTSWHFSETVREYFCDEFYKIITNKAEYISRICIDCRGWGEFSVNENGYQKFVGLSVLLAHPHNVFNPVLMDATVEQIDGYRFFYLLPWDKNRLLIEDTYYSNSEKLDKEEIKKRILAYIDRKGWLIQKIENEEYGILPLALKFRHAKTNEIHIGASCPLIQPVTGYTLPTTFKLISLLISKPLLQWQSTYENYLRQNIWRVKTLCYLNRMMFLAAQPDKRYIILQRFYHLSEALIQRFYSGQLRLVDFARILIGKPPVSIYKAIKVFFKF